MKKKKSHHYQCKLKKNGDTYTYSWVPEKFAKVGKFIVIGVFTWEVIEVYGKMNSKKVQQRSMDYRSQRKASDI